MYPGTCALPFTCLMGPYGRLQSHGLSVTTPQGRLRPVRPDSDLSPRRRHDAVGNHSGAVPRHTRRIDGVGVAVHGPRRRPSAARRHDVDWSPAAAPTRLRAAAPDARERPAATALRRRSQDLTSSSAKTPPSRQKRLKINKETTHVHHSRRRVIPGDESPRPGPTPRAAATRWRHSRCANSRGRTAPGHYVRPIP